MLLFGRKSNLTTFQIICDNKWRQWFKKSETYYFSFSYKIWNVRKTETYCISRHLVCKKTILIGNLNNNWWGNLKNHEIMYWESWSFNKIKEWIDIKIESKIIVKIIFKPYWYKINIGLKTLWIKLELSKVHNWRTKSTPKSIISCLGRWETSWEQYEWRR